MVLFKQLEEEKVDGFSDQYAETTCKTRESSLHSRFCLAALEKNPKRLGSRLGGESADHKQPGSMAEIAVEKAEKGKGEGGEVGATSERR